MPGELPVPHPGPAFVGHQSIFQFVNADTLKPAKECGQAAIATVLANYHIIPKSIDGLREVEKAYPPDMFWGVFGTGPDQIRKALKHYHLPHHRTHGREKLEKVLRGRGTAISLVQNTAGLFGIGDGAHWFVVFGCDANGVYVTNYGSPPFIDWATFEKMWSGTIPTAVGMTKTFFYSPYGPHGRST